MVTVDHIEKQSNNAIAVMGTDNVLQWLPLSQITIDASGKEVIITVPKWLADQQPTLEFEEE